MHTPVLLREVLHALDPQPGDILIDATLGLGGHAEALLKHILPDGKLIAFEQDPQSRKLAEKNLAAYHDNLTIFARNYSELTASLREISVSKVDGILFDLGISSLHLDQPERGFSFRQKGPLDMRMNPQADVSTAGDLINFAPEQKLCDIFRTFGEEPHAAFFAREIVRRRAQKSFEDTLEFARFLESFALPRKRTGGGHPAGLVFQALRIAVNNELNVLETTLPQILPFLRSGAKIAIISFHSLEDRIVKTFFRTYGKREKRQKYPSKNCHVQNAGYPLKLITKRAILPTRREVQENPRARSARLRVAEEIA